MYSALLDHPRVVCTRIVVFRGPRNGIDHGTHILYSLVGVATHNNVVILFGGVGSPSPYMIMPGSSDLGIL